MTRDADLGVLIGRGVEVLREGAIHVGRFETAVSLPNGDRAVLADLAQNAVELRFIIGFDEKPCVTRIRPTMPDPNFLDRESPAERRDLIEDFGKQQAVDDVARDFDFFRGHRGVVCSLHRTAPCLAILP